MTSKEPNYPTDEQRANRPSPPPPPPPKRYDLSKRITVRSRSGNTILAFAPETAQQYVGDTLNQLEAYGDRVRDLEQQVAGLKAERDDMPEYDKPPTYNELAGEFDLRTRRLRMALSENAALIAVLRELPEAIRDAMRKGSNVGIPRIIANVCQCNGVTLEDGK